MHVLTYRTFKTQVHVDNMLRRDNINDIFEAATTTAFCRGTCFFSHKLLSTQYRTPCRYQPLHGDYLPTTWLACNAPGIRDINIVLWWYGAWCQYLSSTTALPMVLRCFNRFVVHYCLVPIIYHINISSLLCSYRCLWSSLVFFVVP